MLKLVREQEVNRRLNKDEIAAMNRVTNALSILDTDCDKPYPENLKTLPLTRPLLNKNTLESLDDLKKRFSLTDL